MRPSSIITILLTNEVCGKLKAVLVKFETFLILPCSHFLPLHNGIHFRERR